MRTKQSAHDYFLNSNVNDLFSEFFGGKILTKSLVGRYLNDQYIVENEMPGIKRDQISATVEHDTLKITWIPRGTAENAVAICKLPDGIDYTKITTTIEDGILTISFGLLKPRGKIPIKII